MNFAQKPNGPYKAMLFHVIILFCLQWPTRSTPITEDTRIGRLPSWFTDQGSIPFDTTDSNFEERFHNEMEMRSNLIQQRTFPAPDPPEEDGQGLSVADINTYDKFHYEMVPRVSKHKGRNYRMDCGSRFGYNHCSDSSRGYHCVSDGELVHKRQADEQCSQLCECYLAYSCPWPVIPNAGNCWKREDGTVIAVNATGLYAVDVGVWDIGSVEPFWREHAGRPASEETQELL